MCQKFLYEKLLRPLLFQLDSETAHELAHLLARSTTALWPLLQESFQYRGDDLKVKLAGMEFNNPVGLAAGFDKNGRLVSMLGSLGFGFAEIGSITARKSLGNPKPRLFRLPQDQALINRLGLNGDGADAVAARLKSSTLSLPVGINIAKTNDPSIIGDAAIQDILYSFTQVKDLPVKYVTINASCPNTKEKALAETKDLSVVFEEVQKCNQQNLPLFVKLSPDSSPELLEGIVESSSKFKLAGFICGNTTTSRDNLKSSPSVVESCGAGGLSGSPLKKRALQLCTRVYKLKGTDQVIIAVGGVSSGQDAYDFIKAGASAIELYTALVYHGPTAPRDLNLELSQLLRADGITIGQAVGMDHRT